MRGKTHNDFIQDAALLADEEAFLGQMHIATSQDIYSEFLTRLERPSRPNELLRNTMQTPAPWDKT
jgi:uncharacterized protein (DUF1778 family)